MKWKSWIEEKKSDNDIELFVAYVFSSVVCLFFSHFISWVCVGCLQLRVSTLIHSFIDSLNEQGLHEVCDLNSR